MSTATANPNVHTGAPEQVALPAEQLEAYNQTNGRFDVPSFGALMEAHDTLQNDIVETAPDTFHDRDGNPVDAGVVQEARFKSNPENRILDADGEARATEVMGAEDPDELRDEIRNRYEDFAADPRNQGKNEAAIFRGYKMLAANSMALSMVLKDLGYVKMPSKIRVNTQNRPPKSPTGLNNTMRSKEEIRWLTGADERTDATKDALLMEELQGLAPKQRREAIARLRAEKPAETEDEATPDPYKVKVSDIELSNWQLGKDSETPDPVEAYRKGQADRLREAGRDIRNEQRREQQDLRRERRRERAERVRTNARRVGRAVLRTMENVRSVALGTYIPEAAAPQVDLSDVGNEEPEVTTGERVAPVDNGQFHEDSNAWLWRQFPGATEVAAPRSANTSQVPDNQSRPHTPHPDDADIDLPV